MSLERVKVFDMVDSQIPPVFFVNFVFHKNAVRFSHSQSWQLPEIRRIKKVLSFVEVKKP